MSLTLIETLITSITSIIVALISAGLVRSFLDKRKENNSRKKLVQQIERDQIVYYTIREIRRKYNSDRIFVMQFHNGGNFYTESPMQKLSITYERCSDGLERITEKYQNILISHMCWYVTQVINKKMFYYNTEDIEDVPTRAVIKNFGSQSHLAVPIYDKLNHLVGIVGLDWVFSEPPSGYIINGDFTPEMEKEILGEIETIVTLL
jgi:hypothetical protein